MSIDSASLWSCFWQRVIFNIVNMSKKKNHLLDGMTPIVRSTTRPKWQRLPNQVVHYYRSPEHRNHYVLSFTFAFDREEEIYHFALCRPYSYSRCQAHLEQLDRKALPHVRREVLTVSLQHRRLDVLTITASSNMDAPLNQRVVVILARVHPGEAPASFICQGLIDFLVSSHPIAVLLRDHVIFKVVPMMNPDGVFLGNQRCSLLGIDLNRGWIDATPLSHPTLDAVQNLLADLNQRKDVHLDFVFDIHAHTSLHGAFIYGNSYDDVYRFERHIVYPKLLAQNAEDFNSLDTMYNRDPKKAGTARRYLCATLKDSVNCYTLFASLHGYRRDSPPYFLNYSEEGCILFLCQRSRQVKVCRGREGGVVCERGWWFCGASLDQTADYRLGRNVARTYLDYYHVVGVIPLGLPVSPGALKRAGRRSRPRHRRRSRSWPSREPRRRTPGGRLVALRPHQVQCYCVITSSSEDDDEEAEAYFLAGRPFPPPRGLRTSPPRGLGLGAAQRAGPARHLSPPGAPRARRKRWP
ncbi:hypothetical protein FOCC_FOCC003690 [Frankliniella occidentalis]|nr:hypothetical protein FOCC_FOCC003690 [Frankliniella occidentalis]